MPRFPLGCYCGDLLGDYTYFPTQFASFVSVMGARPSFMDVFVDYSVSFNTTMVQYMNDTAAAWVQQGFTDITPVIGVAMAQTSAGADAFFQAITAGTYDAGYHGIVDAWTARGFRTLYLRLGYEMNGTFMPWYAGAGAAQQAHWIAAFQYLANLMRNRAAANGAVAYTVWNPTSQNDSGLTVASLYPGDDYVDAIGVDIYSDVFPLDLYNWDGSGTFAPDDTTWASEATNRRHFWQYPSANQANPTGQANVGFSVAQAISLASLHGKPLCVPETGAGTYDGGTDAGPVDDPAFVRWLYATLNNSGLTISFVNIWDYSNQNGSTGDYDFTSAGTDKPLEQAVWVQYFGVTGSTIAATASRPSASITVQDAPASPSGQITATTRAPVASLLLRDKGILGSLDIVATAARPSALILLSHPGSYVNTQSAARPRVPQEAANEKQHRKMLANGVNRALKGQIDCTFPLTLIANSAATQVSDSRISKWTTVVMSASSANAAAEMASGDCYVTVSDGLLTVTHRNNSQTDRTFQVALIG